MDNAVQIVNLIVSGITMLGFLGGLAAVFIRIGKREEQIDHLATAVGKQAESTDRLNLTLRAMEVTMARMEQAQRETDRRLSLVEKATCDEG